jgi:hypothetical protein
MGSPATLVGHQAKLLKAIARLLLLYVRWQMDKGPWTYADLQEETDYMQRLLDGPRGR